MQSGAPGLRFPGAVAAAPLATAAPIATVTAAYSLSGSDDPEITVNNVSGLTLSNVTISSDGVTISLGSLAVGASDTYFFDQAPGSPFALDGDDTGGYPQGNDTLYQVLLSAGGMNYASEMFSPNSNETGGFFDFLGLDNDSATGIEQVASVGASVPEPASLALLGGSLAALGMVRRRKFAVPGTTGARASDTSWS